MLIGCRALPPCSSQLPTHGQITNPEKSPNMKYTTTKPQRGGCFASAAGEERPRGLQTYPREAGEASELNSQNGSRALIGRRHSRTFNKERGRKMINAKKGTLSLVAGGRREEEACVQDNYWALPSKNKNRKEKRKKTELSSMSRRGLYPPKNVKANVVPNLGFPSPVQLQGGRGCAGRRGSGIADTSIATRLGSTSACPRLLVFKHTITLLQTQPFRRVSTRPPPVWAVWKQFGRPRGRTPWSAPKLEG